jgi:hypothetical protein
MSEQGVNIQIPDKNHWEIVNNYKMQGLLLAIGRQNAKILSKHNGTTEDEEFDDFLKAANAFAVELPGGDQTAKVTALK